MLASMKELLVYAEMGGYAIGAFNIYNLEGVRAVWNAAEATRSPVMLQIHPAAFKHGGAALIAICLAAAHEASVPIGVHLDHSTHSGDVETALRAGVTSIMADGSHLSYDENVGFTHAMARLARQHAAGIEAELGRLSGTEDGLTVQEYKARLTDPARAAQFVAETGIDALAVCIGNVHGHYRAEPKLDFSRLRAIRQAVAVPLVLHGASGLPAEIIQESIRLGVRKFNVNTELRDAYRRALQERLAAPQSPDLLELMQAAIDAMQGVVTEKLKLFGSGVAT